MPWEVVIRDDQCCGERSLVLRNTETGREFYLDGRPQDKDPYRDFRFSTHSIKRLLEHINAGV